jgi:SEC-C motif-containing protein
MYRIDGSVCLALDQSCINPSCTCREVRVPLLTPGSSRTWTEIGDILYDLDSLHATRLNSSAASKSRLVSTVRGALERRHDVIERFSGRLERLKEVGRALKAASTTPAPSPVSSLAKAGRDDPCSCGSGRKYKKCCLNTRGRFALERGNKLGTITPEHRGEAGE